MVGHTLLAPEATSREVMAQCQQAVTLGTYAVSVSPSRVRTASEQLVDTPVRVAAVVGFPSGARRTEVKVDEAARAVVDGADELELVINLGAAREGRWPQVSEETAAYALPRHGRS